MRPTSGLKASGATCIARWTLPARPSTSCYRRQQSASRAKALGGANNPEPRVINTDKHAAYPPAQSRRCPCNTAPYNISTMFWNRIIGQSSAGYALASIFAPSGELGARSPVTRLSI
jgi:hypothetical protein